MYKRQEEGGGLLNGPAYPRAGTVKEIRVDAVNPFIFQCSYFSPPLPGIILVTHHFSGAVIVGVEYHPGIFLGHRFGADGGIVVFNVRKYVFTSRRGDHLVDKGAVANTHRGIVPELIIDCNLFVVLESGQLLPGTVDLLLYFGNNGLCRLFHSCRCAHQANSCLLYTSSTS